MNSQSRWPLFFKIIFSFFLILVIFNLVLLDVKLFNAKSTNDINEIQPLVKNPLPSIYDQCPNSCLSQINEATASIKLAQPENNKNLQQLSSNQSSEVSIISGVKEFFIPFGSGSNNTEDWADISGIQVYVDSTQYGRIKSVTFEASMRIPTGNESAYVRLFNATDKHPVWFSEVSLEGGTPQLLISKPITLDTGNKLYQVQMKTSLKYQAILDQARLHITIY